jgi:ribonuclease P/MRP protein subunit POP3
MHGLSGIQDDMDSIPILRPSWHTQYALSQSLSMEPTHIKQLRTTAPKDIRAAKEARARGLGEAKERKKQAKEAKKKGNEAGSDLSRLRHSA